MSCCSGSSRRKRYRRRCSAAGGVRGIRSTAWDRNGSSVIVGIRNNDVVKNSCHLRCSLVLVHVPSPLNLNMASSIHSIERAAVQPTIRAARRVHVGTEP